MKNTCEQCKIEFEASRKSAKFCSKRCKNLFWRNATGEVGEIASQPTELAAHDSALASQISVSRLELDETLSEIASHSTGSPETLSDSKPETLISSEPLNETLSQTPCARCASLESDNADLEEEIAFFENTLISYLRRVENKVDGIFDLCQQIALDRPTSTIPGELQVVAHDFIQSGPAANRVGLSKPLPPRVAPRQKVERFTSAECEKFKASEPHSFMASMTDVSMCGVCWASELIPVHRTNDQQPKETYAKPDNRRAARLD